MNKPNRSARLKAALRDNLKRRKAQARGRESDKNIADHPDRADDSPDKPGCSSGPEAAPSDKPARANEE